MTRTRAREEAATNRRSDMKARSRRSTGEAARQRLLSGIPLTERRLELAGVSTAVLEGGDGPPVVLLHVIEDAGDDPAVEQPEAFLRGLQAALDPAASSSRRQP